MQPGNHHRFRSISFPRPLRIPMLHRLFNALLSLFTGQQPDHDDHLTLRARAAEEGDAMARCFQESHQAYASGNRALAKDLSNKGKEHRNRMEDLNRQASDRIFTGKFDSFLSSFTLPTRPM